MQEQFITHSDDIFATAFTVLNANETFFSLAKECILSKAVWSESSWGDIWSMSIHHSVKDGHMSRTDSVMWETQVSVIEEHTVSMYLYVFYLILRVS